MGFTKICVTTVVPSVFIIAHQYGVVKENFKSIVGVDLPGDPKKQTHINK